MKIQTSRESHRADKRYSGVYQQQGRMITDADWNELMEIVTERRRESLGDVVQSGVPRDGGLEITFTSTNNAIKLNVGPGHLYAGGILARLPRQRPYDDQDDFPKAPDLPTDPPYKLYADVWDRALTSIEDGGVRDAALHGADTCARTQTMVQIKWCPDGLVPDPEKAADNPSCGNAPLKLSLRKASTATDPCDPCAAEELGDDPTKIGNYLFRVEVHDVKYDSTPDRIKQLTLKWSSENGAEQYALKESVPEAYQGDDWTFELFSDTTERHLGVHLAGGEPKRGTLWAGYPVKSERDKYDYVRRWDGFVVLDHADSKWKMDTTRAVDRKLKLTKDRANGTDGFVVLENGRFEVHLSGIKLELELDNRLFVAGDYWTAPVREAIDTFDAPILESSPPAGIVHHYLTLGRVITDPNGGGLKVEDPPTPTEDWRRRRLDFPSLTTLMARDVGLEQDTCDRLFDNAPNVQQALTNLCNIDAGDIAYVDPECLQDRNGAPTVWSLMQAATRSWPDFDKDERATVKDMLDALLCQLDAARIPYDPTSTSDRWTEITDVTDPRQGPPPNTVQAAIDTLVDNLESSDIGYVLPSCTAAEEGAPPTFKDLVKDLFDESGKTDVKELWDELLCHLDATRIPYDPRLKPERWDDIIDASGPKPNNVQAALDTLVQNLESSDIGYTLPTCAAGPGEPPLFKDLLAVAPDPTNVKKLWDEVLCRLNAATVPVDKGLNPPLSVPTVRTVQDALNVLAGRGGRGGLAAVLEELANAIGIMPDDKRRDAMIRAPATGDQSIAEATYGLVVDLLRIAAAFTLEYVDLKGIVITPEGELTIGTSASVNLLGTIRPEARAFATDQIRARTNLWDGLKANFKNVFWCVLAEFLASKHVAPAAVVEMGRLYGSETGYNGPAARLAFLEQVYHPLFGSDDLDHTTLATLRALVLEFLAALWKRITLDVFIHEPPGFSDCPVDLRWLQSKDVQRVWNRVREPDGLIRFHPASSTRANPSPRLVMERVGKGSTWIVRSDSIERYLHSDVAEALAPSVLRQGKPCPDPSVILQVDPLLQVRHAAPAVFAGHPALEVMLSPLANFQELVIVDVARLPSDGSTVAAPGDVPLARSPLRLRAGSRMVLGDGRHSPVVHLQRDTAGTTSTDLFLWAEQPLATRFVQSNSDGTVLAVYNLTKDRADAGPSHAIIVESTPERQRLMLIAGNGTPWWEGENLRVVAHVALHTDVTVVGAAHDQLILQVVQPTGSGEDATWAFVPFRTLAESLWSTDRARFDGFWNTLHPDGKPLFESLDGSVTPPIPEPPIRERPIIPEPPILQPPILEPPILQPPIPRPPIPQPLITEQPITQPLITERPITQPPIEQPVRGQPLDIAGTPLFDLDLTAFPGRPARGHPLPLFPGVVRRTGPAGADGWLTVLAEDEILGLYKAFDDLLPKPRRRYHVNNAAAALGAVIEKLIVIGDVTDTALQFDLGLVARS